MYSTNIVIFSIFCKKFVRKFLLFGRKSETLPEGPAEIVGHPIPELVTHSVDRPVDMPPDRAVVNLPIAVALHVEETDIDRIVKARGVAFVAPIHFRAESLNLLE